MAVRAVIFDLDGTLIRSAIPFEKMKSRVIKFLEEAGVTPGLLNKKMLNFEITRRAIDDLKNKGFSQRYIRKKLCEVSRIMNEVELESLDEASIISGVPETLKALRERGLKIGLMTRSCREYAEKILEKFNLRKYFNVVIARDDVENPKPDPAHAMRILDLLDVSADETLFIGDHWSDMECAKRSGLKFVLFSLKEDNMQLSISDVPKIREMKSVLKIIDENL